MNKDFVSLSEGSGGKEMNDLIKSFTFRGRGRWKNCYDDSATLDIGDSKLLVFTTDSFVINPIFFPGGDIGHVSVCGTINDLAVMGATPLGLSLGIVLEEGFSKRDLKKIINSINKISKDTGIPIVTGDTKVMEKGKVDKIVINVSGVGIAKKGGLLDKPLEIGDRIIISGGIGEHAIALLSKRFDYKTSIITDSKPLVEEISSVRHLIKAAKDPTRGGIAATLNDISQKHNLGMLIDEESIPAKKEVRIVSEMLGINLYELACEGRFICISSKDNACLVENTLKKFNSDAKIIGTVTDDNKVVIDTQLGRRILPEPRGLIVPRIC